jgi:hypothetical protein
MAGIENRARGFRDNVVAGLVTAFVMGAFFAIWPFIDLFSAVNFEPYQQIWSLNEGKKSVESGYQAVVDACDKVSARPEKFADDVVRSCQRISVAQVHAIEALVREKTEDESIAILADTINGKFDVLTMSRAQALLRQQREAAAASLKWWTR